MPVPTTIPISRLTVSQTVSDCVLDSDLDVCVKSEPTEELPMLGETRSCISRLNFRNQYFFRIASCITRRA